MFNERGRGMSLLQPLQKTAWPAPAAVVLAKAREEVHQVVVKIGNFLGFNPLPGRKEHLKANHWFVSVDIGACVDPFLNNFHFFTCNYKIGRQAAKSNL